jgi:hypothetical protein
MKRFPDGAGGDFFFQKRVPKSAPDWVEQMVVSFPSGRSANYLLCQDRAHLAWPRGEEHRRVQRPDRLAGARARFLSRNDPGAQRRRRLGAAKDDLQGRARQTTTLRTRAKHTAEDARQATPLRRRAKRRR